MGVSLVIATAPVEEPITAVEAKAHANVEYSTDDTLIGTLITAARQYAEDFLRRQIVTATWDWYLDAFPNVFYVPLPPLQSITYIKYYDVDGTLRTLSSATYHTDIVSQPGRIACLPDYTWPSTESGRLNAVNVRFVAGYGAATAVPQNIKQAIKFLVTHWYEHRQPVTDMPVATVPMCVEALLYADRVWKV
jgi:uncharacterized phiE125 gp8 family phage protein